MVQLFLWQLAKDGDRKILGDKIRRCPECRLSTIGAILEAVLKNNSAGILVRTVLHNSCMIYAL